MDPRQLFIDQRLRGFCVYCGHEPNSRDHVPSKVLLDDPLPSDLPVVEACPRCNEGFSLDEEYLACFLECVISGSTNPDFLSREKIKRILSEKRELASRIRSSCHGGNDGLLWKPEDERVRNVVLKLARGHVAYELGLPLQTPRAVSVLPLHLLSAADRNRFEEASDGGMWPEVGSRAFLREARMAACGGQSDPWITVQQGRYRYSVENADGAVRIVLSEYLACAVHWE